MPQIIFRVYTPEMGAIITSADAFYETTMCLCSELQLLGSLVTVWESFWADQFPFEGNRPCLIWRSRPCSSSDVAWASLESQDDPMFPRDVFKDMTGFGGDGDCKWSMWKSAYQPTASALKAVSVMKEWAAHILSKHGEDAVVLNVEGKPMTSGAMHSFLKEVIRKHRQGFCACPVPQWLPKHGWLLPRRSHSNCNKALP